MPSSTLTHREKSTDVQETYARHPRKAPDHDTVREVERVVEIGPPRDANFIARVEHIESSPQLQVHRAGEEHIPGVGEHVVGKAEAKKSGEVKQEREHGGAYDNREMHSWRGKIRVRADQKDTPGGKASGPPHQHEATDPCLSLSSDRSVTPPPLHHLQRTPELCLRGGKGPRMWPKQTKKRADRRGACSVWQDTTVG